MKHPDRTLQVEGGAFTWSGAVDPMVILFVY
jgi:hypothetical protein